MIQMLAVQKNILIQEATLNETTGQLKHLLNWLNWSSKVMQCQRRTGKGEKNSMCYLQEEYQLKLQKQRPRNKTWIFLVDAQNDFDRPHQASVMAAENQNISE